MEKNERDETKSKAVYNDSQFFQQNDFKWFKTHSRICMGKLVQGIC